MASEIKMGYFTGKTLTYGVYQPDGTVRTAAGTSLPEVGTTGYYVADDANILAGDVVVVKEGTVVRGSGEYKPEVSASGITADLATIEGKIDIIDGNVDDIETAAGTIDTNVDSLTTSVSSVLTAQQQVRSDLGGEDPANVKIVSNL